MWVVVDRQEFSASLQSMVSIKTSDSTGTRGNFQQGICINGGEPYTEQKGAEFAVQQTGGILFNAILIYKYYMTTDVDEKANLMNIIVHCCFRVIESI